LQLVCETVDLFATQLIRFMFEELENEVDLKTHEQQWIELQAMVDQTERDVELASIDLTVVQKLKTYKFMPCITKKVNRGPPCPKKMFFINFINALV